MVLKVQPEAGRMWGQLWRAAVLAVAVGLSVATALITPAGGNPDEAVHVDALRWFEHHLLPPPLEQNGLLYSGTGWSRVYTGEAVYSLFGRLGAAWHWLLGDAPPLLFYRLLNSVLLAVLLVPLLWGSLRTVSLSRTALLVAATPQLIYLFSYANSDAVAVLAAALLWLAAVWQLESPRLGSWSLLGALVGLVLVTKASAWPVMAGALGLVAVAWLRHFRARAWLPLAGVVLLAVMLAAPLRLLPRLVEPGPWPAGVEAMRAHRAEVRFHPQHPTAAGYHLRQQGVPLSVVATDVEWWGRTGMSLWAMYGFMTTRPPLAVLASAGLLWAALGGLGVLGLRRARRDPERDLRPLAMAGAAVATLSLSLAASLVHSWVVDYQPQGRYLLPALVPMAMVMAGLELPSRVAARVQTWLLVALAALGWIVAALLPGQVPNP